MALTRKQISEAMAQMGRKGGANSRKNLTPEHRKELAQRAARARWEKRLKGGAS